MERLVEVVQRRAHERAQRFVGRDDGGARRRAARAPTRPAARPHPPQQGGQLRAALAEPGRDGRGRDRVGATSTDADRRPSAARSRARLIRCLSRAVVAIFGPTGVGKTGVAIAAGRAAARARRGPGRDQLRLDPGLPGARGPDRRRRRGRARRARAPAARLRPGRRGVQRRRRYAEARPRGDRRAARRRARRPIVVGGTGLYLRAALADLDLVPPAARRRARARSSRARPSAAGGAVRPAASDRSARLAAEVDRQRIAASCTRLLTLGQGLDAGRARRDRLWTADTRAPDATLRPRHGPRSALRADRRPRRGDGRGRRSRGGARRRGRWRRRARPARRSASTSSSRATSSR